MKFAFIRYKFWAIFIMAAIVMFGYVLYLQGTNVSTEQHAADETVSTYKIDETLLPVLAQYNEIKNQTTLSKSERQEAINHLIESMPDKHKQRYYLAFGGIKDIRFYGRVIDQYGRPVVSAKVYYEGTGKFLSSGAGVGFVYTDDNGDFVIKTKGHTLVLGAVVHKELDIINYPRPQSTKISLRSHVTDLRIVSSKRAARSGDLVWGDYSKDNPLIIRGWRISEVDKVKKGELGVRLIPDGRKYTLDFNKRLISEMLRDGEQEGHIRLNCMRDDSGWRIMLIPISGGIVGTDDLYLNLAPISGYQSSLDIDMRKNSNNYKTKLLNQRYYFYANTSSREVYGSLFMEFQPNLFEEKCTMFINEFKINTEGKRGLVDKR